MSAAAAEVWRQLHLRVDRISAEPIFRCRSGELDAQVIVPGAVTQTELPQPATRPPNSINPSKRITTHGLLTTCTIFDTC